MTDEHARKQSRRLLQGMQLSLGNLAMVYYYTGRFEKAIRNAEIVLDIVRTLAKNTIEIARARATVGRIFTVVGRSVDARHHLGKAQHILQEVEDPLIAGRVFTDLGFLNYRGGEFLRILEYYRANELKDVIQEYIQAPEPIQEAETFIQQAIHGLEEEKELADAYYAFGELYMLMPPNEKDSSPEEHWRKAEEAFHTALRLAQKSHFEYRVIDTLESLITLYYFWNGDPELEESEELKPKNDPDNQMAAYQEALKQYDASSYPGLFGKYAITLGDIDFDEALSILKYDPTAIPPAISSFQKAFSHYVDAIYLMKQFHEDDYYVGLRVLYNRLKTLVDEYREGHIPIEILEMLKELHPWEREDLEEIHVIYHYAAILRSPEMSLRHEIEPLDATIWQVLDAGNFGWALLLNDCLIAIYRALLSENNQNEDYWERLILRIRSKAIFYRHLGNDSQAEYYLKRAQKALENLRDAADYSTVKSVMGKRLDALKASLQALEGTLLYRRGEYEQIIEFYLQDELGTARGKFDRQYGRDRTKAFEYLEQGEQTLQTIVDDWENQEANEEVIRLYRAQLGETRFRLGELLMLHEQFLTASTIQQKTFAYFKIAIDDAESCGYRYLAHDARQSWANALYFADPADSPDNEKRTQRLLLEEQLEQSLQPEQKMFPSVMGKLRITQGDVLFSHYFIRRQKPPLEGREPEEGKDYEYVLRDQAAFDKSTIWKMLRLYVEACDFMAQHGTQDFVAAVRTLQRRIELIAEPAVLDIIAKRLGPAWNFCPNLKEAKQDELDALVQFCQLRNIILDYERPHE